jgi:Ornithine cyclodeaminase/mu-crystallin family
MNEAADILVPVQEGRIGKDHILSKLGDVLAGGHRIRTSDDDITLFRSLGLAIEDLAAAYHVYKVARTPVEYQPLAGRTARHGSMMMRRENPSAEGSMVSRWHVLSTSSSIEGRDVGKASATADAGQREQP